MAGVDQWAAEAFTEQEYEDPALDPGPPVSIRSLKAAVKRRKWIWIATAFVGLILGASLHVVLPSKISAISKVYLAEPGGADPSIAINNDLSLLGTRKVAVAAMAVLGLDPNQGGVAYKGSAESSTIVAIKATGPTAAEAMRRTDAVVAAFLATRSQFANQATDDEILTMQAQVEALNAAIQQPALNDVALKEQDAEIGQRATLKNQIVQAHKSQALALSSTGVIDRAYVPPSSAKKTAIKDGLSGLIAGLALGITIVIIGELMSDRVRARSDVAAALGVPVELSVGRLP